MWNIKAIRYLSFEKSTKNIFLHSLPSRPTHLRQEVCDKNVTRPVALHASSTGEHLDYSQLPVQLEMFWESVDKTWQDNTNNSTYQHISAHATSSLVTKYLPIVKSTTFWYWLDLTGASWSHNHTHCSSPPARWGLLDFMSVACSSPPLLSSSSCSTATLDAQCSLSDLNHDHPRPVFPAGPQPRPSPPSVPCRTSTTTIHAQCSLPDLNHDHPRPVFPAGPHVGRYGTKNVQKKVRKNVRQVCYIFLANSRVCGRVTGAMPLLTLQVVHWPVWSCLSKPVESSGVYFTWPTDMFIKGSLGGETSVLRTFRMSGKELVKERVSEGKS